MTAILHNPLIWNAAEARLRAGVRVVAFLLIWRLLSFLLDLLLIAPLALLMRAATPEPLLWLERALHFVLYLAATLLALIVAAPWLDRRRLADYGLAPRGQWQDLLAGTLLGLILMGLIFGALWAMGWLRVDHTFYVNLPGVPFAVAILGPLLAFVVIALVEELLFRGYLLRNSAEGLAGMGGGSIDRRRAVLIAWLLSSLLFGLYHVFNPGSTWVSTFNLSLAGLMLGLPVILTGRLGFAVGLHFAWNFAQGTLFGFPVSGNDFESAALLRTTLTGPQLWTGGAFGPEAGLLGLLALAAGGLIICLWAFWREGGLQVATSLAHYAPGRAFAAAQTPARPGGEPLHPSSTLSHPGKE